MAAFHVDHSNSMSHDVRLRACAAAFGAALLVSSCSLLPPSMRHEEPTTTITGATEHARLDAGFRLVPYGGMILLMRSLVNHEPLDVGDVAVVLLLHAGLALALFGIAFAAAGMYLLQEREVKGKRFGALFLRLPSLDSLDRMVQRLVRAGFVVYTVALVAGTITASAVWKSAWSWDPQQVASLVIWTLYGGMVQLRHNGWHGRRYALLTLAVFVSPQCHACEELVDDLAQWTADSSQLHVQVLTPGDADAVRAKFGDIPVLLHDGGTGGLVALLNASPITAIRTRCWGAMSLRMISCQCPMFAAGASRRRSRHTSSSTRSRCSIRGTS